MLNLTYEMGDLHIDMRNHRKSRLVSRFFLSILGRSKIEGGGGGNIHIFVFTDLKNNRFQKKLIMQNPPPLGSAI